MMDIILTAVLVLVLANLILGVILWFRVRKLYSYPGLLGFPVVGNLFYFYRTLFLISTDSLMIHLNGVAKQYGKSGICFHYSFGFKKVVLITAPQVIKKISYHPNLKDKSHYGYQAFVDYLVGPFSWILTDDSWKTLRKEYNCLLRKQEIESNYYEIFLKSADKLVELMLASRHSFDVHNTILCIMQLVSMETLLGVESSLAFDSDILHAFIITRSLASMGIGNPLFSRLLSFILRPFDELINRKVGIWRRTILRGIDKNMRHYKQCLPSENTESHHPLATYIASRIEKNKESDRRMISEIQELFLTSTHTISSVTVGAITFLAVLDEIQERAWKEQYEIFGDDIREPTLQDLEQMKFLDRFINESLRFCGPPFVEKQATADIEVDGIIIPKDAIVTYLLDFMRHDPNHWKNPEKFDPDRFLEKDEGLKYSFAPFGIGIRSCPGFSFAITLMKIILSKVLRRTKISSIKKGLKFEDLEFNAHILIDVKNPPLIKVMERL